jgi:hypothetical protein
VTLSVNSRSIAGVSHSTDSHSLRLLTAAGAPLIRTCRRSGAAASVPVPISISPRRAATPNPPGPSFRAISASEAPRKPRPGVRSDTASSMLVLPAPLSPDSRTKPGPGSSSADA